MDVIHRPTDKDPDRLHADQSDGLLRNDVNVQHRERAKPEIVLSLLLQGGCHRRIGLIRAIYEFQAGGNCIDAILTHVAASDMDCFGFQK